MKSVFERASESLVKAWIDKEERYPLLIDGARQVGKSFLINEIIAPKYYRRVLKLDFMKHPEFEGIFEEGLSPKKILKNAQLLTEQEFDSERDLLFFEEVGCSQKALTSLKFFAEDAPNIHLIATGSNLGLMKSFPVGKTHRINMYPLTFCEFLKASEHRMLVEYVEQPLCENISEVAHNKLISALLDYFFVGGMPAVVKQWVSISEDNPIQRINAVREKQALLLKDYRNDFGKYSTEDKTNALHIEKIYNSMPHQIMDNQDGKLPKFKFKGVIGKRNTSYENLSGPISFLEKISLISRLGLLETKNKDFPHSILVKENAFKLVPHDVGLLSAMVNLSYQAIRAASSSYKGFIAETYVLNEMMSTISVPSENKFYAFKSPGIGEIEFVLSIGANNNLVPIEVKSGTNDRAKSLTKFVETMKPAKAYKLTGKLVNNNPDRVVQQLPLYKARTMYLELMAKN
ncbi:hypothetical protein A9Q98_13065 [Thalassotalea sp. 42_200_T64]|nr:hypothetical protein A9Q98_13065 [Thalassotalea sp. 42_200_T64]